MRVFIWGMGIFCFAFLLHIAIWKVRIPKRQTRAIIFIFFGVLAAWVTAAFIISIAPMPLTALLPRDPAEYAHVILFVGMLSLYYISFYTLIEADSPSFMIALKVDEAGKRGLEEKEIFSFFTDEMLVLRRLDDLVHASMVSFRDGRYRIRTSGAIFIRPFIWFRKVLGCGIGG
jgi:hypothetical protein